MVVFTTPGPSTTPSAEASDVDCHRHGPWDSLRLTSLSCLFNGLFRPTTKKTSTHYRLFVRTIHQWPIDSNHQSPVTREPFLISERRHGTRFKSSFLSSFNPDSKVYEANMGPTWVPSAPGGPYVGTMNLAIREAINKQQRLSLTTNQELDYATIRITFQQWCIIIVVRKKHKSVYIFEAWFLRVKQYFGWYS